MKREKEDWNCRSFENPILNYGSTNREHQQGHINFKQRRERSQEKIRSEKMLSNCSQSWRRTHYTSGQKGGRNTKEEKKGLFSGEGG